MTNKQKGRFPDNWYQHLKDSFNHQSFKELREFVILERQEKTVFPHSDEVFNAFNLTPFDKVKVVILGQDPYHGFNQAHGLAFSVRENIPIPPSLKNIYQELNNDLKIDIPETGNLEKWAKRGVFLLNTVLTVRENKANSHRGKGWENFTDSVIKLISDKRENIVFILWGRPAQNKETLINQQKHLILKAPHPSPLSAFRGFFGSSPFSKTNQFLTSKGELPINWKI